MAPADEADSLRMREWTAVPVAEPCGPDIVIGEDMGQRLDVVGTERGQNEAACDSA
jgi:hypothetical protein